MMLIIIASIVVFIQCHRGHSLDAFFDALHSEINFIAIVGCGCAPATEPVAEISHRWNISTVGNTES